MLTAETAEAYALRRPFSERLMDKKPQHEATPPAEGRQDHYAMRADAMRAVTGPAGTETLAAGGGLELPGHEEHESRLDTAAPAPEPIPGDRDASTLTHREPGAIGAPIGGADVPTPNPDTWMDSETARLHRIEGGGQE